MWAFAVLIVSKGFSIVVHAAIHSRVISAYETANNPDGGAFDSNPYGLLAEPGSAFVADAGGNALLEVRADGVVSPVAAFASIPIPLDRSTHPLFRRSRFPPRSPAVRTERSTSACCPASRSCRVRPGSTG